MDITTSVHVINEVTASVPATIYNVPTTTILEPTLYEHSLWETITTLIQNVINLI